MVSRAHTWASIKCQNFVTFYKVLIHLGVHRLWHIGLLDVPKSIAGVTKMKMMHKEVGIR
jgi:hypothetical protein